MGMAMGMDDVVFLSCFVCSIVKSGISGGVAAVVLCGSTWGTKSGEGEIDCATAVDVALVATKRRARGD